jgi:Glutamine synthetase
MPKPFQEGFGSGAHLNVSLADIKTGKNLFDNGIAATRGTTGTGRRCTARSRTSSPRACWRTARR